MHLNQKFFLVLVCLCFSAVGFARDAFIPEVIEVVPDHVFSPQGFDDNDKVEVVIDGTLRNSCYKIGPTDVFVDEGKIFIRQYAYYYGGTCLAMESNYTLPALNLGLLKTGRYEIVVEKGDKQISKATLPIGVATHKEADENLYAPVSEAQLTTVSVNKANNTKTYNLAIKGMFDSGCAKLKEGNFVVHKNIEAGVIEVLPILQPTGELCVPSTTPYEAVVSISDVPEGRYLVHIRSLSGASYNLVRDL